MTKIVFWARLALARESLQTVFGGLDGIEFVVCHSLEECVAQLPDADGLLLYNAAVDVARTLLDAIAKQAPRLRWMHFLTAGREGFEAVGLPDGVEVTHSPGASAPVVAEHAIALALALGRQLPAAVRQTGLRQWDRGLAAGCQSLEGQQVAIVGYGRIGREVARRARAFGSRILAVSRSGRADEFADEAFTLEALPSVLARADVAIIALALAPQTRHAVGREALAACKPGMFLVNVARGAIVDQHALRDALRVGRVAGAGLDVTDPEPPAPDDPIWDCPNVIVSPHIASDGSPASAQRVVEGALRALHHFLESQ